MLEGASDPPPVSSIETPAFAEIQRTVHEVLPEAVVAPSLVIAMTDSRHYNSVCDNVYRFMPVRIGPEDIARIHGTNEPWTIGHAVSSGCIRLRNEDVMELYDRIPVGTPVVVL